MLKSTLISSVLILFATVCVAQQTDYDSLILIRNCVLLDAKESVQDERDDLIYKWNFGDGSIGAGEVVEHCYESIGTYEVNLTIVDPELLIMTDDEWLFEVEITADYRLTMGFKRRSVKNISLVSNLAYLETPDEVNYFWDYGDGTYGVGEKTSHSYNEPGSYSVRLLAEVQLNDEIINISTEQKIQID